MKVTIINGCNEDTELDRDILNNLCKYLDSSNIIYSINNLGEINPKNCTGCDFCQNIKPGICAINDEIGDLLKEYMHSDVSIIITPVQFGLCNSITKNFIDRTEPLFLPYQVCKNGKSVMKRRYNKYPNLIFIGIMNYEDIDSLEVFKKTILNCNLSQASDKVNVEVVQHNSNLDNLRNLLFQDD